MNSEKYIGLDVHQATISVAVLDSTGKLVMESILETKAATILEFFAGLRGTVSVTFEEGTWAAWLYDVLKPHVAKLVVCNPRKNALLKDGNKSDRIDAHKLAELLYLNKLSSVYHGETGVRMLRELARSYLSRTTLPATGHAAVLAPASAPRAVGGESQACHHRQTTADSLTGTDSLRLGGGADPDPASFPH